jgi:hypothetical protein
MHGEMKSEHSEMKSRHMHGEMKKEWMWKKMYLKKMMEHLSEEDKKKLAAAKLDMKISMAEKKIEIINEKKKIMAMKFDMKAAKVEKKIEMLRMMRDMIKEKI